MKEDLCSPEEGVMPMIAGKSQGYSVANKGDCCLGSSSLTGLTWDLALQ